MSVTHNHPIPVTRITDAAWHLSGDLEALDIELQTSTIAPADLRDEYVERLKRRLLALNLPESLAKAAAESMVDTAINEYTEEG